MTSNPVNGSDGPAPRGGDLCPRCHAGLLRAWAELGGDEREVARRLPAAPGGRAAGGRESRRWCVRCWHAEGDDRPRTA